MPNPVTTELSDREREILSLLATGASNKEIAQTLTISANTVKVHLHNIFAKIGAASRTEAALYAVRIGIVQASQVADSKDLTPTLNQLTVDVTTAQTGPDTSAVVDGTTVFQPQKKDATQSIIQTATTPVRSLRSSPIGLLVIGLVVLLGITGILGFILYRNSGSGQPTIVPKQTAISRWQELTPKTQACSSLAIATYEDQVYAIGGQTEKGPSSIVERLDTTELTWKRVADKPTAVSEIGAAVIGGLIYVPGGRKTDGTPTNVLEVYDPRTDRWQLKASLPVALSGYAITSADGRLYIFGGWDGQNYSKGAFLYDPVLDQWKTLKPMKTGRSLAGAAVSQGRIYVIGGFDGKQALTSIEVYTPYQENAADPWSAGQSLPVGRMRMAVVSLADTVYILGGQSTDGPDLPSVAFFPRTSRWQSQDSLPDPMGTGLAAVVNGTVIYIVGGEINSKPSGRTLIYQPIYSLDMPVIIR